VKRFIAGSRCLVGVLGPVVQILRSTVFHATHQPLVGHTVAGQLVGDQNVQDVPILVDRTPQVLPLTIDLDEHLVKVPPIAWSWPSATQLVPVGLPEPFDTNPQIVS
jgi:hypothetical protein